MTDCHHPLPRLKLPRIAQRDSWQVGRINGQRRKIVLPVMRDELRGQGLALSGVEGTPVGQGHLQAAPPNHVRVRDD
jgi:hypothetical protein